MSPPPDSAASAVPEYDLIVIGSGPAGVEGAKAAAFFGAKVCVIEKNQEVGGAAVNTGTLPSKTLRETALALSGYRSRQLYGVDLSLRREVSVRDLMHHERNVENTERGQINHVFNSFNIDLLIGAGSFVDPHTVKISGPAGERLVRGKNVLIACGSDPMHPEPFQFELENVYDSDEILEMQALPRSLAVVGAGVIGTEYACMFQALGCDVHLVDRKHELLPFMDQDVSAQLVRAMESAGVRFYWDRSVTGCTVPNNTTVKLALDRGELLKVDAVLVAAGRTANTGRLNLPAVGVTPGAKGKLDVNENYQTNVPHIYATGDVIGFPALASTGMQQSRVAMAHSFAPSIGLKMDRILPYGIYSVPECGMVGETEQSLKQQNVPYVAGVAKYSHTGRGVIIGDQYGFLKLLFHADTRKLLGVHAIGENASDLIHVGQMVMLYDGGIDAFARACFNYPTLGDLYKHAAGTAMAAFMKRDAQRAETAPVGL